MSEYKIEPDLTDEERAQRISDRLLIALGMVQRALRKAQEDCVRATTVLTGEILDDKRHD